MLPTAFQFLANYKTLAAGILLVFALLYLPSGLYGGFVALVRRISGDRSQKPRPLPAEAGS